MSSAVGLLINTRSSRNPGMSSQLLDVARRHDSVRPYVLDGVDELPRAVADMASTGVDTVVLGGGDGTTQAALTETFNGRRFDNDPRFVALPCGMTNVIAADCGLQGSPLSSLDNFLWRRKRGEISAFERPLMSVRLTPKHPPTFGFFLGAGHFYTAVKFSREKVQAVGARRSFALRLSVTAYVVKTALFDRGEKAPVVAEWIKDDGSSVRAPTALLMMTTLHKLTGGIYPFWTTGAAPLRLTTIKHPPQKLLSAMMPVLSGKGASWLGDAGYASWSEDVVQVKLSEPFVYDGEIFHPHPEEPLTIDTTQRACFLR
ncbi:MAG: diacylglycerol kinase family protein [Parvularculaceae bacterium]